MKKSDKNVFSPKPSLMVDLLRYKKEYYDLKMLHAVSPVENPMKIRVLRKIIARLMTEINAGRV